MFIKWLKKLFETLFHLSPTETETDTKTVSKPSTEEQKIYWGEPSKDIDNPEWEVKCISSEGIQVSYCKEYGTSITVDCIGLWYSKKLNKYRLTWKDARFEEVEAVNISSIQAKILKSGEEVVVDEKKKIIKEFNMTDIKIFKEIALPLVLKYEGGYTNHPNDKGGETNKGVIQREYDSYRKEKNLDCQSVKFISKQEVEDIYFNKYWIQSKCNQLLMKVAIVHFDTAVNTGIKQASKFLQRSAKVEDDGIIGKITLEAVNKLNQDDIVLSYLDQRRSFYNLLVEKNSTQAVFLKGWLNRVSDLQKVISNL